MLLRTYLLLRTYVLLLTYLLPSSSWRSSCGSSTRPTPRTATSSCSSCSRRALRTMATITMVILTMARARRPQGAPYALWLQLLWLYLRWLYCLLSYLLCLVLVVLSSNGPLAPCYLLTCSLNLLTHLLTHSPTYSLTYLLTHLLAYSPTYSLTYSLTHLLADSPRRAAPTALRTCPRSSGWSHASWPCCASSRPTVLTWAISWWRCPDPDLDICPHSNPNSGRGLSLT